MIKSLPQHLVLINGTNSKFIHLKSFISDNQLEIKIDHVANSKFSLATRKALRILVMPSLSRKAKLVVLAEIIETVRQIGSKTAPKSWSLQHKQDYFVWSEKAVAAMGNINPTLFAVFAAEIENSK